MRVWSPFPPPRGGSWPQVTEQPAVVHVGRVGAGAPAPPRLGHPVSLPAPGPQPLSCPTGSPTLPSSGPRCCPLFARPVQPECLAAAGPSSFWKSHHGVRSRPDVRRPPAPRPALPRRPPTSCRAVALSPDGLAGSSSFLSDGRRHGSRAVGTGSRLPQPLAGGPPGGPVFQPGTPRPVESPRLVLWPRLPGDPGGLFPLPTAAGLPVSRVEALAPEDGRGGAS